MFVGLACCVLVSCSQSFNQNFCELLKEKSNLYLCNCLLKEELGMTLEQCILFLTIFLMSACKIIVSLLMSVSQCIKVLEKETE